MVDQLVTVCGFVFGSHFARRTVREFITVTLLAPLTIATIWFSSFGTAAIEQAKSGTGALADGIGDVSLVLFQLFEALPMGELASLVGLILLVVFRHLVDSGALVIDGVAAGGIADTPLKQRVFWACIISLFAIVLLVGGGAKCSIAFRLGRLWPLCRLPLFCSSLLMRWSKPCGLIYNRCMKINKAEQEGAARKK